VVNSALPAKPLHLAQTLLIAGIGGLVFDLAHFPAGWMAGAMVAVAIAALAGAPMYMPTLLARGFFIALGITVGGIATPETVHGMMTWPLSIVLIAIAMLVTTVAASFYLTAVHGWTAQTAMFAAVPGALSQVVVMAVDRDADLRGIVVVQTVRAIATTIGVPIALILFGLAGPARFPVSGPGVMDAPWQAALLIGAGVAAAVGLYRVGFSGGFFFGPMVVSAILHGSGFIELRPPGWFANLAMVGLGAVNGSRFAHTPFRTLLHYLGASLGSLAVAVGVLLAFVAIAAVTTSVRVSDLVVSYAPGAVDAMMILAIALQADPVFVGACHLARIMVVSLALPFGVRLTERLGQKPHHHELPAPLDTARDALED
jgi:membrane AbrB-like protein